MLIAVVGRGDVEMKPVPADLRYVRTATPGDEPAGAVRRADRRFLVLIPDQRPTQRVAPELPDLSRTVARQRSKTSAASEERILGLYDTELIAFGVCEHDMRFVRALTNVDVPATQFDQPRDRFVLVVERCGRQIEMDAVPARLGLRNGRNTMRTWCHRLPRSRSHHWPRRRSPSAERPPRSAQDPADRPHRRRGRQAAQSSDAAASGSDCCIPRGSAYHRYPRNYAPAMRSQQPDSGWCRPRCAGRRHADRRTASPSTSARRIDPSRLWRHTRPV
jgi:hypothetical protein